MITIPELLREHVSLDLECVDRVYLNGYMPSLRYPQEGWCTFWNIIEDN